MTVLQENYNCVLKNIEEACKKSGRDPKDVTLIAVSKTKPLEMLRDVYDGGARHFGENKVQEMCEKMEQMPEDVNWHMIGHLQTNKVKYIVGKCALIHSVDSLHLAKEIEKQAAKQNCEVPILVEINIANEETKFGIDRTEAMNLVKEIAKLPHVKIQGLMTIAPYVEDPEQNRQYFHQIWQLSVDIKNQNIDNVTMDILSMGMTGDYMVAVEEGATLVRVGTGIFGERNYNI
ncbi:YggS family pyridoxal phosphate-dependent enzyme [Agathobacter ruminis]|uniref:Pyridoxal phosphate homeostasis protein n=1 Tax=Agathobacter ruminis TaxID=1712665 RepID=A0A2G3E663_9FIRM|nr:YggS family pyridoxal phosphate-dependent enzyme [Agathobacter ruminis]MDC7302490.1 YggS family pyridoxal phosphate-dependent enzyme [Agathobacter ruminis]PHU38583.1 YggS family pyridoxal phosphate-dependent enzyme [Agathobacter ruminis]